MRNVSIICFGCFLVFTTLTFSVANKTFDNEVLFAEGCCGTDTLCDDGPSAQSCYLSYGTVSCDVPGTTCGEYVTTYYPTTTCVTKKGGPDNWACNNPDLNNYLCWEIFECYCQETSSGNFCSKSTPRPGPWNNYEQKKTCTEGGE